VRQWNVWLLLDILVLNPSHHRHVLVYRESHCNIQIRHWLYSSRSTWSSSVVTISRPPTSSSLKITNCSIRHSTPYLWNKLPESFREPHPHLSTSASQSPFLGHARSPFSSALPLSPSITPSLFHSRLKTHFLHSIMLAYKCDTSNCLILLTPLIVTLRLLSSDRTLIWCDVISERLRYAK